MACSRKSLPRALAATVTTALVSMIFLLALAPAASARVTVVPGTVQGGGTETFAVRVSNEMPDTPTTRVEITFPPDLAIPLVETAPADGWIATVEMRPVDPPITVADQEIDQAVASVEWTGGEIGPRRFEQFLVTAGPLPDGGSLVFTAEQGYGDGTVDRWTEPGVPGWPGAPTIALVPGPRGAPQDLPAGSTAGGAAGSVERTAGPVDSTTSTTDVSPGQTSAVPWILLAGGVLVGGVGSYAGYRRQERRKRAARRHRLARTRIEKLPARAGRR